MVIIKVAWEGASESRTNNDVLICCPAATTCTRRYDLDITIVSIHNCESIITLQTTLQRAKEFVPIASFGRARCMGPYDGAKDIYCEQGMCNDD